MANYAVRISLDLRHVVPIVDYWAPHAQQIIAYEHNETERLHCHLLLLGVRVTTQRLKQLARRQERGNAFWNFKSCEADTEKYITYMSKGVHDPFCNTTEAIYDWRDLQRLKQEWQAPAPIQPKLTARERFERFVTQVRERPVDQRSDRTWIRLHATNYLMEHHGWITQQFRNELRNYEDTYAYRYKI